jgi:hypothetical protein
MAMMMMEQLELPPPPPLQSMVTAQPRPPLSIAPRLTISSSTAHAGSRQKQMGALLLRKQRSAYTPHQ